MYIIKAQGSEYFLNIDKSLEQIAGIKKEGSRPLIPASCLLLEFPAFQDQRLEYLGGNRMNAVMLLQLPGR